MVGTRTAAPTIPCNLVRWSSVNKEPVHIITLSHEHEQLVIVRSPELICGGKPSTDITDSGATIAFRLHKFKFKTNTNSHDKPPRE
ncbi:hypothetical protein ADIAG_02391 [Paeniglutamicibacter gangotriensis Lz1y]|uniref:Uncharacterized protein n=1 Tax=Paeniglutamicibacter gangotriensis Lz1y TaxID=1276920 RepID=M7MPT5_9MICC|nr:hypothetical protein ADIAG_02391 [Paeniglutamicibacter gangotriensis Lz1y]